MNVSQNYNICNVEQKLGQWDILFLIEGRINFRGKTRTDLSGSLSAEAWNGSS